MAYSLHFKNHLQPELQYRACLHEGEVTRLGGVTHLSI